MKRIVVTYRDGSVCPGVVVEESSFVIVVIFDSEPDVQTTLHFKADAWFDDHGARIDRIDPSPCSKKTAFVTGEVYCRHHGRDGGWPCVKETKS